MSISINAFPSTVRGRREEPAFTPSVAESLSFLESLRNRGWDLTGMTSEELQDVTDNWTVVYEGRPLREREVGSHTSQLLYEAETALKAERNRRNLEHQRNVDDQRRRISHILDAAKLIEDAAQRLEWAERIADCRVDLLPRIAIVPLDPEGVESSELERIAADDDRAAGSWDKYASDVLHAADVLLSVKDQRFRAHAKTLKDIAAEATEDAASHRARAAAARAELNARAERDRQEQEANAPAKSVDVQALAARVAELEAALADK